MRCRLLRHPPELPEEPEDILLKTSSVWILDLDTRPSLTRLSSSALVTCGRACALTGGHNMGCGCCKAQDLFGVSQPSSLRSRFRAEKNGPCAGSDSSEDLGLQAPLAVSASTPAGSTAAHIDQASSSALAQPSPSSGAQQVNQPQAFVIEIVGLRGAILRYRAFPRPWSHVVLIRKCRMIDHMLELEIHELSSSERRSKCASARLSTWFSTSVKEAAGKMRTMRQCPCGLLPLLGELF
eukprot:s219_g43.t1